MDGGDREPRYLTGDIILLECSPVQRHTVSVTMTVTELRTHRRQCVLCVSGIRVAVYTTGH